MNILRYSLVSDGPSDRSLIPHLTWLLRQNGVTIPIYAKWSDFRHLRQVPKGLTETIEKSIELYPCELLFIHRDAERETVESRLGEIEDALTGVSDGIEKPPSVCVIPVKMQEAWLLFDEMAIRRASGNPNGKVQLNLPRLKTLENLLDPKQSLFELLKTASEKTGRRLRQFNIGHSISQVAQFIDDFSQLRVLPAFQQLENDILNVVQAQDWH